MTIRKPQISTQNQNRNTATIIAVSRQHEYRLNKKNLLKGYQVATDSNMMDSNNNILAMKNGDENGNRPLHTANRTRTDWGQQQHQSTSHESKNVPISVQHQQRRPFQTLNSNTSSIGSSNSDMFRSSSNTTKPLKVRTFSGLLKFCCHFLLFQKFRTTSRVRIIDIFVRHDFPTCRSGAVFGAIKAEYVTL